MRRGMMLASGLMLTAKADECKLNSLRMR